MNRDEKRVHDLANSNLQALMDQLWGRNYQPASMTLALNPAAEKVMGHFIADHDGRWRDAGVNAGQGSDLIGLVQYCSGVDRETALVALRDFVDQLPPPTPPVITSHEVARPLSKVRTIHRSPTSW